MLPGAVILLKTGSQRADERGERGREGGVYSIASRGGEGRGVLSLFSLFFPLTQSFLSFFPSFLPSFFLSFFPLGVNPLAPHEEYGMCAATSIRRSPPYPHAHPPAYALRLRLSKAYSISSLPHAHHAHAMPISCPCPSCPSHAHRAHVHVHACIVKPLPPLLWLPPGKEGKKLLLLCRW
jgi:hypothetical protein